MQHFGGTCIAFGYFPSSIFYTFLKNKIAFKGMKMRTVWKIISSVAAAAAITGVVACTPAPNSGARNETASRAGFKSLYEVARTDLEKGRYKAAVRGYNSLIKGSNAPRMALELSHAQLRNGDFDAAAETARQVAEGSEKRWRGSALAVLGTAEHEMARARVKAGKWDAVTQAHLLRAASALDEVLDGNPALDPSGSMKRRRAAVAEDVKVSKNVIGTN